MHGKPDPVSFQCPTDPPHPWMFAKTPLSTGHTMYQSKSPPSCIAETQHGEPLASEDSLLDHSIEPPLEADKLGTTKAPARRRRARTPSNAIPLPEVFLTSAEVLQTLKISRATLYRWMQRGGFPNYGFGRGRCLRFRMSEIQRWQTGTPQHSPLTEITG